MRPLPRSTLLPTVFVGGLLLCATALADPIQMDPQATPDKFRGIQTTGVIRPVVNYTLGAVAWSTTTNPLSFVSASTLSAEGLENPFMQALSNELGSGWSYDFNTTANIADNSFKVHTYEALAPTPPASNNDAFVADGETGCVTNNNCVGSEFYFTYKPTGDDPTTNVHWVQILYDNYAGGKQVPPFYEIDNKGGTVPYYDVPFAADGSGYLDLPFTRRPGDQTIFDSLLLLVSGPAAGSPGKFTIYGGLTWGWSNQPTPLPEPASWSLMLSGFVVLVTAAGRKSLRG